MEAPIVLCSSESPNGNVEAFVDQDSRVAYFYVRSADDAFRMRSCWLRNLGPSGDVLDIEGMRAGIAPMMPRGFCHHPDGEPPLEPERLRIVWFEEGDAAALIDNDRLISIIPCWSGTEGFSGYSASCLLESPLASPLTRDNPLIDRLQRAQEFWADWADGAPNPWPEIQKHFLACYADKWPREPKYYAIDNGTWPPRAMMRYPADPGSVVVTAGMSIRPMPTVELFHEDPADYCRIELAMALSEELLDEEIKTLERFISGQTLLPWAQYTWLGEGHTLPCDALPIWADGFDSVILALDPPGVPEVNLGAYRGNHIQLLWMIPITAAERQLALDEGSVPLLDRLWTAGHTAVFRRRAPVV